jgi:hypothetical protein
MTNRQFEAGSAYKDDCVLCRRVPAFGATAKIIGSISVMTALPRIGTWELTRLLSHGPVPRQRDVERRHQPDRVGQLKNLAHK